MHPTVVISSRGEERLQSGHPWIYRADVANVHAGAGDIVQIRSPRGRTLGSALYSDRSQIALRLLSYGDTPADLALIRRRLESAIAFRRSLAIDASAYRLVHGEADLLPSLIVDVTATIWSSRRLAGDGSADAGADADARRAIAAARDSRAQRSAGSSFEGLERQSEVVAGDLPESVTVTETGIDATSISGAPEDGSVSRPAETARRPPPTPRPAARLLPRQPSRWCSAARATNDRDRRFEDADPRTRTRRVTASCRCAGK
jgi:23S rRNA (cytosine1962-C5)-methyltransferase